MSVAQRLIEQAATQSLLGIPLNNGAELFHGSDRCVYGFQTMADRSGFVQDAEAKGFDTDELDADAYPDTVPDTYPFLVIVWAGG